MKIQLFLFGILLSLSGIAQPSVTVSTLSAADTIIFLPTNTITLTGVVKQANPGHPVLDTTWKKTSGPAATITNASNRMTTTVTGLVLGAYTFELTARDKKNSASATLNVRVISGLLPVGFSSFHVAQNDHGIILTWRTDMESNNSHFIVQKSVDGSVFTDIASIASKAENGNSNVELNYAFQISGEIIKANMNYMLFAMALLASIVLISRSNKVFKTLVLLLFCLFLFSCSKSVTRPDAGNLISSKTFYRLKQVDMDGHFTYSAVEMLH